MKTPAQWYEDHYPIEASSLKDASDTKCLLHAIAKWEGLKKENLPQYWYYYSYNLIELDGHVQLTTDETSCALCEKYSSSRCRNDAGESCPIKRLTGKTCCDPNSAPQTIYHASASDPQPMIDLLHAALHLVHAPNKRSPR